MRVAICDCDLARAANITSMFRVYGYKHNLEMQIDTFSGAQELQTVTNKCPFHDIYLLHCTLQDGSGIEAAKNLRMRGFLGKILFMDETTENAYASFAAHPFFYFLTSFTEKQLFDVLEEMQQSGRMSRSMVIVNKSGNMIRLTEDDVLYVDVLSRVPRYHLTDGRLIETYMLRTSFKEAMTSLVAQGSFVEGGVSLLINLNNIVSVDKNAVLLLNKETVYLSRAYKSAFNRVWNSRCIDLKRRNPSL